MCSENFWRRFLAAILSFFDLLVLIFAFFGGINMFEINTGAAYGTLLAGTAVAILSIGLWTGSRVMQIIRIGLYSCGLLMTSLGLLVGVAKGLSIWPIPVIAASFLIVCCLSVVHFRLWNYSAA